MKHLAIVSGSYTSKVSIDCGSDPIASLTEISVGIIQAGRLPEEQRSALRPVFVKPHDISVRRRNPEVVGKRGEVPAIAGDPRAIARSLVTSGEGHLFDTETFRGTPIPLGEIRTNEDGRLLVKRRRESFRKFENVPRRCARRASFSVLWFVPKPRNRSLDAHRRRF